jgi:hypothetical protein
MGLNRSGNGQRINLIAEEIYFSTFQDTHIYGFHSSTHTTLKYIFEMSYLEDIEHIFFLPFEKFLAETVE